MLDSYEFYEFLNFRLRCNQIFFFWCGYGQKWQVAWQRTDKNYLISVGSKKKILIFRWVLSFSHSHWSRSDLGLKSEKSFVKTSSLKPSLRFPPAKKVSGGIKQNKLTGVAWDEVIRIRGGESRISKNRER